MLHKDYLVFLFSPCYNIWDEKDFPIFKEYSMSISYDKLWKLLIDRKMNRTALKAAAGISFNVLAKMGKGEAVSMESMLKICKALDCDISDVMEIEKYDEK